MSKPQAVVVTGREGLRGTIDPTAQPKSADDSQMLIELDSGQRLLIPKDVLEYQENGTYYLPYSLSELESQQSLGAYWDGDKLVVPLLREDVKVHKRRVETGGVRLHKVVHEREEIIDEPLTRETVEVERVPVNRVMDQPLTLRTEGDTMILPVMEEVLVVQKRWMLKEEIRITRRRMETRQPQQVILRSEEITVEPLEGPQARDTGAAPGSARSAE